MFEDFGINLTSANLTIAGICSCSLSFTCLRRLGANKHKKRKAQKRLLLISLPICYESLSTVGYGNNIHIKHNYYFARQH